jgi:hypothetical protein
MLSDLIKVVETLLKLLDMHTTWDRRLFDDHIKPLFDAMFEVHTDYIETLSKAKALPTVDIADKTPAERVIALIDDAQIHNQALRRTASMAKVAATTPRGTGLPRLKNFFLPAQNIFPPWPIVLTIC